MSLSTVFALFFNTEKYRIIPEMSHYYCCVKMMRYLFKE